MTCQLLPWVLASLLVCRLVECRDDPRRSLSVARGSPRREADGLGQGAERREHRRADPNRRLPDARAPAPGDPRLRRADPAIQKDGRYYYNFWRDAKNPRGLWRRTTLEEYRKDKPAWEVVLDLDALARQEAENWVWHGAQRSGPSTSVP